MSAEGEEVKIEGLGNAIKFIDEASAQASVKAQEFFSKFEQLTGYKPNQQMNALDVYKIVHQLFTQHGILEK
jgi:hypothetical protein